MLCSAGCTTCCVVRLPPADPALPADLAFAPAAAALLLWQVARRKGPDGKLLSMGFGFVETDSEAAAKAAIQDLQVRRRLAAGLSGGCWHVAMAALS